VEESVKEGARLAAGGGIPKGDRFAKGNWVEPTVLADVKPGNVVYCNEMFGPVLSCIRWDDGADEIAMANDTEYGLAAYVFTSSAATAERAAAGIQAGSVCVNEVYYDLSLPHGGTKQSGVGRDCSPRALEEYMYLKRISARKFS
jgi:succinate-semialdehyde dehydrogenase/glutarate-semialdehyde dehydrogenase